MENKISAIEEKLTELKLSKESPNTETLFSGFTWTREWFTQAEEVLLGLAFRGESDKPILDFIRKKIVDTDIVTFNKILRSFSAAPIHNHYEILVTNKDSAKMLLTGCENTKVIDALFKEYLNEKFLSKMSNFDLSACVHDVAVNYLIKNPKRIDWDELTNNRNVKAARYCIQHNEIDGTMLSSIEDDEVVNYLLANPIYINYYCFSSNANDIAVSHLLANPDKIDYRGLSMNSNDRAADYLLANPNKIELHYMYKNTNPKLVDYIVANADKADWFMLCYNRDDKIAELVLNTKGNNSMFMASDNPNQKIVDYLMTHKKEIDWNAFFTNSNDNVVEYLLKNKNISTRTISMVGNECEYNMQKLREFNKLGLFPRIQYLKI